MRDRLRNVFVSSLKIAPKEFTQELSLGDTEKWDSLSHLELMCALEEEFSVIFSTEEFELANSVENIERIIKEKLGK